MPDDKHISLSAPTVFILGAGASHAYGFPLGSELKQKIIAQLNPPSLGLPPLVDSDPPTLGLMAKVGFEKPVVEAFRETLKFSQHSTIDIFLEHKTSLRELGSYLIASTIIPLENDDNLFPKRDWYRDLYSILRFGEPEPDVNGLGVVTLNYDRSFEHFMTKSIDFNVHDDRVVAAHEKRSQIPVIHAHGSLGQYPAVPYGIKPNEEQALRQAAESIRIVSDRLDDSPDFRAAQELIGKADNVVFLGFGYDERTLKALLHDVDMHRTRFFGTAVKLPEDRKREVFDLFNNRIVLGGGKQDCAAFLRYIGVTPDE